MNLDIQKMKRLALSGIDINKLAPTLFENEHNEYSFAQKQGAILDWYLPDFDKVKKKQTSVVISRKDVYSATDDSAEFKKITISNNKL